MSSHPAPTPAPFDATSYAEALERPQITLQGVTYTGRVLSLPQWLAFQPRIDACMQSEDAAAWLALSRDYLRAVFPKSTFAFWYRDPVPQILRLPPAALTEAMTRFFGCQARAMSPATTRAPSLTPPSTSGTGSPR